MRRTLAWLLPCLTAMAAHAAEPTRYTNTRFGFAAVIPPGFIAEEAPANHDGQAFDAPDGSAQVTVSAIGNAAGYTLRGYLETDIADCVNKPPEYLAVHTDWAVLSCLTGRDILYQKTFLRGTGLDAVFTTLRMTYRASMRGRWDAAAADAAASLRPAVPQ